MHDFGCKRQAEDRSKNATRCWLCPKGRYDNRNVVGAASLYRVSDVALLLNVESALSQD